MNKTILAMAALAMAVGFGGVTLSSQAVAADAPPATAPATEAASTKFYGSISAIDTAAKTFTVGEQTFKLSDSTQITKGDGSTGTIADAVVGEPARGSYSTGSDGKTLTATKVRFGKKVGGTGGGKGGKGGGKGGKKKSDDTAPTTQQ